MQLSFRGAPPELRNPRGAGEADQIVYGYSYIGHRSKVLAIPNGHILASELFPTYARSAGVVACTSVEWGFNIVAGRRMDTWILCGYLASQVCGYVDFQKQVSCRRILSADTRAQLSVTSLYDRVRR